MEEYSFPKSKILEYCTCMHDQETHPRGSCIIGSCPCLNFNNTKINYEQYKR
jgi:hypothetical protein